MTKMYVDKSLFDEGVPTSIHYNNYKKADNDTVELTLIDLCTGSDYSGSSVERSNYESMKETFSELIDVYGGYGTYSLAYVGEPSESLQEALNALEDYALFNDNHHSELEMRLIDEAWDSYGRSELRKELEQIYEVELTDPELDNIFSCTMSEGCGEEAIVEIGCVVYFHIDRFVEYYQKLSNVIGEE